MENCLDKVLRALVKNIYMFKHNFLILQNIQKECELSLSQIDILGQNNKKLKDMFDSFHQNQQKISLEVNLTQEF